MSYFRLWVGMQSRFSVILSGSVLLIGMQVATASAEDKLQAYQNSSGKVVFTNLVVENAPAPLQASKVGESSAPAVPATLGSLVDTISTNHGVDPALVRAVIKTE